MAKRRTWYGWAPYAARYRNLRGAPEAVVEGLGYARELDENRRRRRELFGWPDLLEVLPKLTIRDLAESEGVSESTIRKEITLARDYIFPDRAADRTLQHRIKRERELRQRPVRTCDAPRCENALPRDARVNKRYCSRACEARARRAG